MKTIINDVCSVVGKRLSDNKIVFTGEAKLTNITQTINENKISGGIGNKTILYNRNSKVIEIKINNILWDTDFIEMSLGFIINSKNKKIYKKEEGLKCIGKTFDDTILINEDKEIDIDYLFNIENDASSFISYLTGVPYTYKLIIKNIPKEDGILKVIAPDATYYDGEFLNNYIIVNGDIKEDINYMVLYEYEILGNVINFDIKNFSEAYYLELNTIEYTVLQNKIINDLYFIFYKALPSGNIEINFENGSLISNNIKFNILTMPGTNEIGKFVEVSRS